MKSIKILLPLFVFGLGVAAPVTRAADDSDRPPKGEKGERREHPGQRMRERREHHDKMLVEKLKLTADQQTKLAEIRKNQKEQVEAVEGDRRRRMREIMEAGREQIRAMLTPEQQKEFDAMKPPGPPAHRSEGSK